MMLSNSNRNRVFKNVTTSTAFITVGIFRPQKLVGAGERTWRVNRSSTRLLTRHKPGSQLLEIFEASCHFRSAWKFAFLILCNLPCT